MFKYDKKIDNWSQKKIRGLDNIWGVKIEKTKNTLNFMSIKYLEIYLNLYINKYGKKIINRFNRLTGLSYKINDFKFYTNNTPVSLHNAKYLYISIGKYHAFNKYPTIIIHELSHIYFYKYIESKKFLEFNKIFNTFDFISTKEKNELKEIITVIINDEFSDIIDSSDDGYPEHKEIRNNIIKLWRKNKNKDFDKWINNVIKTNKKRLCIELI